MTTVSQRWAMLLLAVVSGHCALAGTPLRHDPFARPVLTVTAPKSSGAPAAAVEETPPWAPNLIAVMVAGKNSLVNLDGGIVAIGQEIDGYRLLQVREREAIFTKGKQRILLKMETPMSRQNKERATE